MIVKTYITCPNCKTVNIDADYCSNCGEIINVSKKRVIERKTLEEKRAQLRRDKKQNTAPSWISQWRNDQNPIKKIAGNAIYFVYIITLSVAAFIAYIAGLISA